MSGPLSRACVVLAALILAGLPAEAQSPARSASEIMLTTGEAPVAFTVMGDIRAEAHKKSMFGGASGRDLVNEELRKQAAKMGADAVIDIKYEDSNPAFSKKGFVAVGKAVKFQPGAIAASTIPAPPAPVQTAAAVAAPSIAATAAPAPVTPSAPPAPSGGPTPAALITLSDQDLPRPYVRLGPVGAEVHQTSMFPKTPTRQLLDEALRANAAKMGADAVIMVKYKDGNALFSKKGSTAEGVAVRFASIGSPTISAVAAPQPAPAVAAAPPTSPAPVVSAAPAPAAKPALLLSEQNVSRPYAVLGPVNSEVSAASSDKASRDSLDQDLRRQAEKIGADAVIMIRYTPAAGGRGPSAIGVAVKFQ
ncbi:MAG TPA: hypothetical protein VG942_09365 [Hyphomonadaceae bacterium]|nr:hypothetical protein [Hyphomonadaceae bacterium]